MAKRATVVDAAEAVERRGKRKWRELKQVEPVKFKRHGDSVEGEFRRAREVRVDGRVSTIYDLRDERGRNLSFWGTPYLDSRLGDVGPGSYIRVTYVEDEDVGQDSPMRVFRIEVGE